MIHGLMILLILSLLMNLSLILLLGWAFYKREAPILIRHMLELKTAILEVIEVYKKNNR